MIVQFFLLIIFLLLFIRMDKSAVGHDYIAPKFKHASQIDYSTGFGGKFGVQSDRIDKVPLYIILYNILQYIINYIIYLYFCLIIYLYIFI